MEAVGADVTNVAPGDRVVCLAAPSCGQCFFCLRGQWELCARQPETYANSAFHGHGEDVVAGLAGLGTFSELITVDHHQVVRTESELPFEQLAVIGCGFKTGVGAVLNTARVAAGETVAVVGCGGSAWRWSRPLGSPARVGYSPWTRRSPSGALRPASARRMPWILPLAILWRGCRSLPAGRAWMWRWRRSVWGPLCPRPTA